MTTQTAQAKATAIAAANAAVQAAQNGTPQQKADAAAQLARANAMSDSNPAATQANQAADAAADRALATAANVTSQARPGNHTDTPPNALPVAGAVTPINNPASGGAPNPNYPAGAPNPNYPAGAPNPNYPAGAPNLVNPNLVNPISPSLTGLSNAQINAEQKQAAIVAANQAVDAVRHGTPEQKHAAAGQLGRANAMPD
jgi:hypothetical protein